MGSLYVVEEIYMEKKYQIALFYRITLCKRDKIVTINLA